MGKNAKGPVKTMQVKPIFSVAPVLKVGQTQTVDVLLETTVSGPEVYCIDFEDPAMEALVEVRDKNDQPIPSKVITVTAGQVGTFRFKGLSPGWVQFRFTEVSRRGQVLGAFHVVP